ncbi:MULTISPECIES: ATP synthase F1 subunit delta [unclassified Leptolyngbya]|uniref:ATP synthase F1 subunit delta n=1 Tax=unclassified Leptolyngbya TaxID=2650499 RepID=UPI001684D490|nr:MULTISPECIES: ATP synthase F1 subunit delta [unclassified Leptolyngbya]MBD1912752.1 F0F1 ATP synthase subunit delta [Leptolyngbya sp. FACHB-8]MBD2157699.1 F0F1 ATP synthase subunit delta [Leptolyngbya sp. FACHB-16]
MRLAAEIVEPYAQALMSIAQSQDLVDRFNEDTTVLLETLAESEELNQFLVNPFMKPETKKAVLRQLASDRLHPVMQSFLQLLVDRGRSQFLPPICKQYQTLVRQMRQIVLAEVISSVELNDEQTEAVRQKVISLTGASQVELEKHIDSDILGGVIIRVGSQVFDASLRGQLRRLGLNLSTNV